MPGSPSGRTGKGRQIKRQANQEVGKSRGRVNTRELSRHITSLTFEISTSPPLHPADTKEIFIHSNSN